jgi:hypothetical protein
LENYSKGSDGLCENTSLLLGAQVGKDLGVFFQSGLGVGVEDGLEDAVQDVAAC